MANTINTLSYSGLKTFITCPFKYRIEYVDGHREPIRNIHIDFGSALHQSIEEGLTNKDVSMHDALTKEYNKLVSENRALLPDEYKKVDDAVWLNQGYKILDNIYNFLDKEFPGYEVISQEEELLIDINDECAFRFKGYVDIVLFYKKKYWVIDFKSTTSHWNRHKRSDEMLHAQLQLYKHFWAKKHNIDTKLVNVAFMLLKRIAKPDNNIELFRVSGSPAKLEVAVGRLQNAIMNIERERFIKNRLSCTGCSYFRTELCP